MVRIDILISNATIYDGSGGPPYEGDIAVVSDTVSDIWRRPAIAPEALEVGLKIDASGMLVMPGFIDAHGHSDFNILANPNGDSKLRQGITTEVVGNCGASAFPLRGAALQEELEANKSFEIDINWSDAAGYFDRVDSSKPAFNIVSFVGHGNIRASVTGFEDRPPRSDEMKLMIRDVEEAMDAGAIGLSTGLIYAPGIFSNSAEIIQLQKAATARGGMYSSHVRGEGDTLLEAADEFFEVVRGADAQGQFSHLKASGKRNWGKVAKIIEQIESTNAAGGCVRFDKYPYIASSTSLSSLLPRWVQAGGRDAAMKRLQDPDLREQIISESSEINEGRDGWASVIISHAGCADFEHVQGMSLAEIAATMGHTAGDTFVELLIASRLSTSICNFTMSQEETDAVLLHELGMVCTDSGCRAPYGVLSHDTPHPRAYGTFPKFFRDYVKDRPLLKIEEAVAKTTSLPCEVFGLRKRGRIEKHYYADLLVIDWAAFRDRAEFAAPHQFCSGFNAIIVNGEPTVLNGESTGRRGGRVLRRNP